MHGRAVAVGNDQRVIGIRSQKLVIGVDGIGPSRTVKRSLWLIDVGLAYDVAYVFETDAARGKRLRIDLNPDGKPLPDWGHVHAELRRRGVTLALLWEESQT